MSSAAASPTTDLVDRLRGLGVRLWAEEDERLRFRAPRGVLTAELKREMKAHKEAILEFLRQTRRDDGVPAIEVAPRGAPLPLSFSQERLWFLEQWRPPGEAAAAAYNITDAVRLRGRLATTALGRALGEIVRRHEVLRTVFVASDGRPAQDIAPPEAVEMALPVVDLENTAVLGEVERDKLLERLTLVPFDLARGALVRATLLRLAGDEHVLVLAFHHIVSDGWSSAVVVRELSTLYSAFARGAASPLPPLGLQYADFAVWQRRWLESPDFERQVRAWTETLGDAEGVLELPTDRPRPPAQTFRGAVRHFRLGPRICAALDHFATGGTTRFMVLLAAFAVLLGRLSGRCDILVGTPVANRRRAELEPLIGFFVNTLAVRLRWAEDPSFRTLLGTVRDAAVRAFDHQDVPFEKLVEALQPERDPGRAPLFQVMFVLQNMPEAKHHASELEISPIALPQKTAKLDLTLTVVDGEAPLDAGLEFNTDLFDATTAWRWSRHLEIFLDGLAATPEARLSELPWITPAEHHQLLVDWDEPSPAPNPDRSRRLHELFEAQTVHTPDATALVWIDADGHQQTWSYRHLDAQASRLAGRLQDLGAGPEIRVGVAGDRSGETIAALLAILKSGGAYVPLDPTYPSQRLAGMLQDASVRVLVTRSTLRERLPEHGLPTALLDDPTAFAGPPAATTKSSARHLAYTIFTSGSTGRPKGVAIEHRSAVALVNWARRAFSPSTLRRTLASTSINFDLSVFEIFVPLAIGGTVLLARDVLDLTAGEGGALPNPALLDATLLNTVPSAAAELLRRGALPALAETVNLAGEPLKRELVEQLDATGTVRHVVNLYGPSEDTTYSAHARIAPGNGAPTIGRGLPGTQARILDRRGRLQALGVPGELHLGGDGLARGYLGRPARTAESFIPDGFLKAPDERLGAGRRLYRTGDLVKQLADGRLAFLGRIDHQVKVRGFRIELGEVEAALLALPEITDAAVLARGEAASSERSLVAYVVASRREEGSAATTLDLEKLRRRLAGALPSYMVPSAFLELDALPLTPNGKINRKALHALASEARRGAAAPGLAPRTPVEETLAEIWSEVLGIETVGVHDEFFTIGGHSLLAVQVLARVEASLGVGLPVRQLFETPRIAELAEEIEASLASGRSTALPALERVEPRSGLRLSFSQERLWLFEQMVPGTATYNTNRAGHLSGPLDLPALEATFNEILRRHEVLRTRYDADTQGDPIQIIEAWSPQPLPRVDLRGLPALCREVEVRRLAQREHNTPMSLKRAPLTRLTVLQLDCEEHVVLLSIHHICYDLRSGNVLLAELEVLYPSFVARRASPLPELTRQYADYAAWQRSWLAGEVLEEQLAYWRHHLASAVPLELPADRPRPATQARRGSSLRFSLPASAAEGMEPLIRQRGASRFMGYLTLFKILLHRYAAQPSLVVGTAISHRNRQELEGLMGFFENVLLLSTPSSDLDALTYADLLRRVREVALGAYTHQHLPFELLVQELRLDDGGAASAAPAFPQAVFLYELGYPAMTRRLAGLEMRPYVLRPDTAKFDMTLSLREDGAGLAGAVEYDADIFDEVTIRRLVGHLAALVEAVVSCQDTPLGEHDLLRPAERHQLLVEWGLGARRRGEVPKLAHKALAWAPAQTAPTHTRLVHELVAREARRSLDAPCLVAGDEVWTYGELERRATRLADELKRRGVTAEVRIGVCAERSPEVVAAYYAILKAGGAYLPLDPASPDDRLLYQVERSGVRTVLASASLAARFAGVEVMILDTTDPSADPRLSNEAPVNETRVNEMTVDLESLAYVMYTSGSTGRPKGVEIRHRSLRRLVEWHQEASALTANDRTTLVAGLGFDASVLEIWPTLAVGGCLELPGEDMRVDPQCLCNWLLERRVTVGFLPTPLAETALELDWPQTARLRHLLTGGDRLRRAPPPGLPFDLVNNYGPAESTVVTTWGIVDPQGTMPRDHATLPDIGRPIDGVEVRVVDRHLRDLPTNAIGELVVGGQQLARGYQGSPAESAERFIPDPWSTVPGRRLYRTGDLVRWRHDGRLDCLGRLDHQVKIRGVRVELGEIEAALEAHPAVQDAVTLALENADGSRRLAAWVVPVEPEDACNPEDAFDVEALRLALVETLPAFMVPATLDVIGHMPLTPNGKIDRRALARKASEDEAKQSSESVAPRTPVEEILATTWADLLGRSQVGIHDSFFALGGHSLLATQLASKVRATFEIELPLETIFDRPTVATLARAVERARRNGDTNTGSNTKNSTLTGTSDTLRIEPVPRDGDLPLSDAQERMWFLDRLQPGDPSYTIPAAVRLRGLLDVAALERAVAEMAQRHESFRTTFHLVGDRPAQRIAPNPRQNVSRIRLVELRRLAETSREAALRGMVTAVVRCPFDLEHGPLLRLVLYRLGDEEHVLQWTLHHIIGDGWSMTVFVNELRVLYAAAVEGRPTHGALPPLAVQPADVAIAQRRWLETSAVAAQLDAWRRELADPPVLDLPADNLPTTSSRAGQHLQVLAPDLTARVRNLARSSEASLFMVLVAALDVVLYRQTGSGDLTIGYPIAGRDRSETEPLIGVFLNTMVLRAEVDGAESFRGLLKRVRRGALTAYDRQSIPFERLLAELQIERNLERTPLFQVLVNMLSFPEPPATLGKLELEPIPLDPVASKFDLTLYVSNDDDKLRIDWIYRADRFRATRIELLAEQLAAVLDTVATDQDLAVDQIALQTPAQLAILPDPTAPLPCRAEPSVIERFAAAVQTHPERTALVDDAGAWTYAELAAEIRCQVSALQAAGVETGDLVAIYTDRSAGLPLAILAVLGTGAAFVILDESYPAARLVQRARLATPRVLLSTASAKPLPESLVEALDALGAKQILLPGAPENADLEPAEQAAAMFAQVDADDLAYLAFTSGSTGEPRAIEGTHAPLSHFVTWHSTTFELGVADRFAMLSGLAHDPLLRDILVPLALGATLVVPPESILRTPDALRAWLANAAISVAHLTPALGQLLVQDVENRGSASDRLPSLRRVFFSGEVLRGHDVARLRAIAPSVQAVGFYGATETPQAVSWQPIDDAYLEALDVALGRGIEGAQLLVLTAADQLAAIGELGEIVVRTPHLARGYRGDAKATAERFGTNPLTSLEEDRIYRTGDLGRFELDGTVRFAGRRDGQVKIRGFRVETVEVERVLEAQPAISRAVVVTTVGDTLFNNHGSPQRRHAVAGTEHRLVAYLIASGEPPTVQALRESLAAELPTYMIPAAFVYLAAIPLTPNGKIDHRRLPSPDASAARDTQAVAPRNAREAALAEIFEELLGGPMVGIHDDFFTLGGHSLLAVRAITRIREILGVRVPVRAFFEAPTVAAMSRQIAELPRADLLDRPPLRRGTAETGPLSFAQQRFWLLHQLDPGSDAYNVPLALRLRGRIDLRALARALSRLAQVHDGLRSSFPMIAGAPRQVLLPTIPLPLTSIDLDALRPETRQGIATRILGQEGSRPFDLGRRPAWRARILRLADQDHILLLSMHHIVTDGWSSGILLGDLAALYRVETGAEAQPPIPPKVRYLDYAAWQREHLDSKQMEHHLAFWRETLSGAPPRIQFPASAGAIDSQSQTRDSAGTQIQPFPSDLAKALEARRRQHGTTLFTILLTALKVTLWRWTGQSDLVIGTVITGREEPELDGVVGCFLDFSPLRTRLEVEATLDSLFEQVQTTVLTAREHQACPFQEIVEAVGIDRGGVGNPLYNVGLLLQNFPASPSFQELDADLLFPPQRDALLDLRLVVSEAVAPEDEDGLEIRWEYRQGVLSDPVVTALSEAYRQVLEAWVHRPQTQAVSIDLPALLTNSQETLPAAGNGRIRIALSATFTADPLIDSFEHWCEQLEIPARLELAAYHQVFQELLDPKGLLAKNTDGVNVLLVRFSDWVEDVDDRRGMARAVRDFLRALRGAIERNRAPHLLMLCPEATPSSSDAGFLAGLEELVAAELEGRPGIDIVRSSELLADHPLDEVFDPHAERIGHVPYTALFYTVLGTWLSRRVHAHLKPAPKVLVLDCDNTLWRGVCGEEGPHGMEITAGHRFLQDLALERKHQGMLLALCSKNREDDVWAVFDEGPQMPLKRDDLLTWRINWKPKPENLRSLALELDLGLDSFVFLDDNPVECAAVRADCPEVLTLQLPADPEDIPMFLRNVWDLDLRPATPEDARRTEMYRQNLERRELEKNSETLADFLASLNIEIDVRPMEPGDLPRVSQLTLRTNQFNLSTVRRSEAEVTTFLNAGGRCRVARVRDRFGDYGLVGVLLFRTLDEQQGRALEVETFLLSCRALGRGVEQTLLAHLGEVALAEGCAEVHLVYRPTKRNQPALDFLENLTLENLVTVSREEGEKTLYIFTADSAARVRWRVGPKTSENRRSTDKANAPAPLLSQRPSPEVHSTYSRSQLQQRVASSSAQTILETIERRRRGQHLVKSTYTAPRTRQEEILAEIWTTVLGIDQIGVNDNFFQLGGQSMTALRIASRIYDAFGVSFDVSSFFKAPTIAELARALEQDSDQAQSPLVEICSHGDLPPLYCIHPAGGNVLCYAELAAGFAPRRPVYALRSSAQPGGDGTIETMASRYLAAIHAHQPNGIFHLLGWSMGGTIAYEMACQASQQRIGLITLLDTVAPRKSRTLAESLLRRGFLDTLLMFLGPGQEISLPLDGSETQTWIEELFAIGCSKGLFPPETKLTDLRHQFDVFCAHHRASAAYMPQAWYRGPMQLFRAQERPPGDEPSASQADSWDLGWSAHLPHLTRTAVELTPGNHYSLIQGENAQALAKSLTLLLPQNDTEHPRYKENT